MVNEFKLLRRSPERWIRTENLPKAQQADFNPAVAPRWQMFQSPLGFRVQGLYRVGLRVQGLYTVGLRVSV